MLAVEDVPDPKPSPGQIRIAVERAGVNFTDTYWRSGFYRPQLPFVPGVEAVGSVDALGPGVTEWRLGDRVGFPQQPGAYAETVVVGADRAVAIPDTMSSEEACALMMQGITAHYLATSTFPLEPGTTTLVHAAAGGVGRLLVQVARLQGARVIASVSNAEKARIAVEAGADEVLVNAGAELASRVIDLTAGVGVDVVYDGIGLATYRQSLAAIRKRGVLVLFGQASGPVPAFDTLALAERSLFLTRPRLAPHIETQDDLVRRANDLFAWVREGAVTVRIDRTYLLDDADLAHQHLELGLTTGKVLLNPSG